MKNIIVYGMRGTWKSTIWNELSKRLNKKFIDLDSYIVDKIWETVEIFVSKYGWEWFRDVEYTSLKEVLENNKDSLISLWWWTIAFDRNQKLILKDNYKLIFVYSDLDKIIKRVEQDKSNTDKRPSLTWKPLKEDLTEIYEKRKDVYEKYYDLKALNNWKLDDCLDGILDKINYWNICIPIIDFENGLDEKLTIINNSRQVKYVELRIDYLDDIDRLESIISNIDKQIILTNRTVNEWWKFEWNSKECIDLLSKYINKVNYVDFELRNLEYIDELKAKLTNQSLILSYHDFVKTPSLEELKNVLKDMSKYNPDVYKIAVMPNSINDVEILEKLVDYFKANYKWDFIFISMWKLWEETRIDFPKKWWLLTFWSFWKESAPWQINYEALYNNIFND